MGYYNVYKHIDNDIAPSPLNMDQIAEWAENQNYGAHRLVCALIQAIHKNDPVSELASALYEAVDKYTV